MNLESLMAGDLIGYYKRFAQRKLSQQGKLFFVHIPKTAGSSFREELADVLQPDINVEVNYDVIDSKRVELDFSTQLVRAILKLKKLSEAHQIPFASGHVTYRQLVDHDVAGTFNLSTMLRDPVQRLISDYRFRTSEQHPQYQVALQKYPTFRHFVEDAVNQNVLFEYLCQSPSDKPEVVVESLRKNFLFVGVQDCYDICLKVQLGLFGARSRQHYELRKSSLKSVGQNDVNADDRRAAVDLNQTDSFIYSHFANFWKTRSPELHYYFDHDRIFKMCAGLPFKS